MGIGMRLILALAALGAGWAEEGRWEWCEVTAYAANCPKCETGNITANGTNCDIRPYGIAASPNLPFGARIYLPRGFGYLDESFPVSLVLPVDDRGGMVRSEWLRTGTTRLDLRFRTHYSARLFGRKLMRVYIWEPQRVKEDGR